jgi:hypothetical protein
MCGRSDFNINVFADRELIMVLQLDLALKFIFTHVLNPPSESHSRLSGGRGPQFRN